jgi:hypothetical protein
MAFKPIEAVCNLVHRNWTERFNSSQSNARDYLNLHSLVEQLATKHGTPELRG